MIMRTIPLFALLFTVVLLTGCVDEPEEVIEEPLIIVGPRDLAGAVVTIDRKEVGALEPMVPAWLNWLSKKLFGRNHVTGDDVALIVELQGTPPGIHRLLVEKAGFNDFVDEFTYPEDQEQGVIFVWASIPVNWPWCGVEVPPLFGCGDWGSVSDIGKTIEPKTVCRLTEELEACLPPDEWESVERLSVCRREGTTYIMAYQPDHQIDLVTLNEETGEVTCKLPRRNRAFDK